MEGRGCDGEGTFVAGERGIEGLGGEVLDKVDICVGRNVGEWWRRREMFMYGEA